MFEVRRLVPKAVIIVVGVLIAGAVFIPAQAHVSDSVDHLWTDHLKGKVSAFTFSKAQANARFVNVTEPASDSDLLDGLDSTAFSASTHLHDDRYLTETESDSKYAGSAHGHDDRYFTEMESDTRYAGAAHAHDDRYLTETESDTKYAGAAHAHDDRYLTEAESDSKYSGAAHAHDERYYTKTLSDDRYYTKTDSDNRYYTKIQIDAKRTWAVVSSAGTPVRWQGVSSVGRCGAGCYMVTFTTPVSTCAYTATLGGTVTNEPPPPGEISVGMMQSPANVIVQTWSSSGAATDKPFHLLVTC